MFIANKQVMKLSFIFIVTFLLLGMPTITSNNDLPNLCVNSTEVVYQNYTNSVTENCGCNIADLCVRKCCQNGFLHYHDEDYDSGLYVSVCMKNEQYNESDSFSVPIYDGTEKVFDVTDNFLIGMLSCNNPDWQYFKMDQKFYIQKNGSLYYAYYNKMYNSDRYCLDEQNGLTAYLCFTPQISVNKIAALIHATAKLISVPFLTITWLIYVLLPERNLHRNALMNHVLSLIPGNTLLAIGQFHVIENENVCVSTGFLVLLFMVASFFWMNVICIDIWLAFSGVRTFYVQAQMTKRIFIIASSYAWGLPVLNVFLVFLLNKHGDPNTWYYPGIGVESCFLNDLPTIIYYFGPVLILIIINLILFVLTALNIQKAKREANIVQDGESRRNSSREDDRFKLYWKLLFVMGLNPVVNTHVIQLIGWSIGKQIERQTAVYIWYFKDFSHACYGIIIFVMFTCQKKIWISLKERFVCINRFRNQSDSKPSTTSSGTSNDTRDRNNAIAMQLRGIDNPQDVLSD